MSRHDCARCQWHPPGAAVDPPWSADATTQAAHHATWAGHPRCIICIRSLTRDETQTCEHCLTGARADLAEIVELYALLPATMLGGAYGQPGSPRNGPRSAEQAIPGGDALVMLSDGSAGRTGAFGAVLRGGHLDETHAADELAGDPQSVAWELARWEDDWRHVRGHPAAEGPATVANSAGYLEVHARWAAREHAAFDEFVSDLRKLKSRLRTAMGEGDWPVLGAECLDCPGVKLGRTWRDVLPCLRTVHGEHCDHGGLSDDWTCPSCEAVYDPVRYRLALAESRQAHGWVPIDVAAAMGQVPHRTVRTWVRRVLVASLCKVRGRQVLVWWPDVHERAFVRDDETRIGGDLRDREVS